MTKGQSEGKNRHLRTDTGTRKSIYLTPERQQLLAEAREKHPEMNDCEIIEKALKRLLGKHTNEGGMGISEEERVKRLYGDR